MLRHCFLVPVLGLCAVPQSSMGEVRSRHEGGLSCIDYKQELSTLKQGADLTLASSCTGPVRCRLGWRLSCRGEKQRRARKHLSFALNEGKSKRNHASARACGSREWDLVDIRWTCKGKDPGSPP